MSIDLSRVTGISDSRGAITEIKDSLGRVIWSAVKEVGTIILRPSADISVEHLLYPTNSTEAYLLINEEVSDGDSTYIYSTHEDRNAATDTSSRFALSPTKYVKANGVTAGKIVFDHVLYSSVQNPRIQRDYMKVGETIFEKTLINDMMYGVTTYELELHSDELEAINSYISQYGTVPPITYELKTVGTASSKNGGSIKVGQIYLELIGEFII